MTKNKAIPTPEFLDNLFLSKIKYYKRYIVSKNNILHERSEDNNKTFCGKIIDNTILIDYRTIRQRYRNCTKCSINHL